MSSLAGLFNIMTFCIPYQPSQILKLMEDPSLCISQRLVDREEADGMVNPHNAGLILQRLYQLLSFQIMHLPASLVKTEAQT